VVDLSSLRSIERVPPQPVKLGMFDGDLGLVIRTVYRYRQTASLALLLEQA
jgi:hypothetical protein